MSAKTYNEVRKGWVREEDKAKLAWGEQQSRALWDNLYAPYEPKVAGRSVLDFGCSWGYFVKYVLEQFDPARIIGVDIGPYWDTTPHGWDWRADERVEFHAGDIRTIRDLKHGSVDLILCTSVLQYLRPEQLEQTLERLHDLLRPGGEMIVRTRTFTSYIGADLHKDYDLPYVHLFHPKRALDQHLRERKGREPRYLNPLTATSYLLMFQRAGFDIVHARRRRNSVEPAQMQRLREIYSFIDDDELLTAELEVRLVRPAEPAADTGGAA